MDLLSALDIATKLADIGAAIGAMVVAYIAWTARESAIRYINLRANEIEAKTKLAGELNLKNPANEK